MKRFCTVFFLFVFLAAWNWGAARRALIVYDGVKDKSEGYTSTCFLRNLLGHFPEVRVDVLNCSEYRRGALKNVDVVFLIFEEGQPQFPNVLLSELLTVRGEIVWMNMHVRKFLMQPERQYAVAFERIQHQKDWRVFYKGEDFPKEDTTLSVMKVLDTRKVQVLAEARDYKGNAFPYFLHTANLWYIADSPFAYADEGGRFLVLAEELHNILGIPHTRSHKALVRLEDVNPESDPAALRRVADYLYKLGIPFQISLVPIFKDPSLQSEVYLSDRPEMIKAVKEAVEKGGAVVMHGVTHQYRGLTGDDYEFWDDIGGRPIPYESPDWIAQRIRTGIDELFRNGIYPIAWETPHYSASHETYRVVGRYFDTFYDRIMATETNGTQQVSPYPLQLSGLGVQMVPENLGYIDLNDPKPWLIVENSRNTKVVRDGVASFFFHPFVPLENLEIIVREMRKGGWDFISLRDFPCNVRGEHFWSTTTGGNGKITLARQYLHEVLFDRNGEIKSETFSSDRRSTIVNKKITLPRGAQFVMNSLDILPETRKIGVFTRLKNWVVGLFGKKKQAQHKLKVSRALVLFSRSATPEEDFDQRSFESVLRIYGFNPEVRELGKEKKFSISGFDIVVVPYASARHLMEVETNSIIDFVEKGGLLITDGQSALSRKAGIRFQERRQRITRMKDLSMPAQDITWKTPAEMNPFFVDEPVLLAVDPHSGLPLSIIQHFGRGRVLFFGTLFDPVTPFGMSRYPFFANYLKGWLGLDFNVRRNNLEFYFDPGQRENTSYEKMVKRWRGSGVKIVYLAAWHFYPKYTFNYDYFIKLCHNHGIAVYAWFEYPYVTQQMWNEHPEWRLLTAKGTDQRTSWRYMLNLHDPAARAAADAFFARVIADYDWDGINLAELNYDTGDGLKEPERYVPFNPDLRQAFKAKEKFDPLQLFEPSSRYYWERNAKAREAFLAFRSEWIRELHDHYIRVADAAVQRKGKEMEVIVTMLDSLCHPEMVEIGGIDSRRIVEMMNTHRFTLQVEDPARSWSNPPDRYLAYFNAYKPLVPDLSRLMFDINVVNRALSPDSQLPSPFAVGSELASTLYYAARGTGRAAIYSEATVNPQDMDILPFVTGSDVVLRERPEGFEIHSDRPFTLAYYNTDTVPTLNGEDWPFYTPRGISIPSGKQFLTFKKIGKLDLERLSPHIQFDGDMYDMNLLGNIYSLRYRSPIPVALSFSRPLEQIKVDGREIEISPEKAGVILPKGEHELEIFTESRPAYAVDVLGYVSSWFFYILGIVSVSLLLIIYLYSRIKR